MFSQPVISTLALVGTWSPDLTQLDQTDGAGLVGAPLAFWREMAAESEFNDVRRCSFTPQFQLLAKVTMFEQLRTMLDKQEPDKRSPYRFCTVAGYPLTVLVNHPDCQWFATIAVSNFYNQRNLGGNFAGSQNTAKPATIC